MHKFRVILKFIDIVTEKVLHQFFLSYNGLRIKNRNITARIFAINYCENASYSFGLCEYCTYNNKSKYNCENFRN